jgi:rubrerythrin
MNTHARTPMTKKRNQSFVQRYMTKRFMRALISTPEGRAHILTQIADAEDNGEARVFDDALASVEDPQIKKLIARHREDEIRHGQLFRNAAKKTGITPAAIPDELKALWQLNQEIDGFFDRPITDQRGVVTAYVVLLALEERAMEQFAMHREVFAEVDPEVAAIFEEVERDEERHLKYCHAITKMYADSEEERRAAIDDMRVKEARAFQRTQHANMAYIAEHRLMPSAWSRLGWSIIGALGRFTTPLPMTRYALAPVAA